MDILKTYADVFQMLFNKFNGTSGNFEDSTMEIFGQLKFYWIL